MSDLAALRRVLTENPADWQVRLLYADELFATGDERGAIVERILAQPESDEWREQYAGWAERNGDAARAEFIRVQCELGTYHRPGGMFEIPGTTSGKLHVKGLFDRESALRAANEARWRAGPVCGKCGGDGGMRTKAGKHITYCHTCHGTGDAGGLMRELYYPTESDEPGQYALNVETGARTKKERVRVHIRRGFLHAVEVPTLAECVAEERVACPSCNGNPRRGIGNCTTCANGEHGLVTGTIPRTVPSAWLRAVLTATPERVLVSEVAPGCRVPGIGAAPPGSQAFFGWGISDHWRHTSACVPDPIFDALEDWDHIADGFKAWITETAAVAALARAIVVWARGVISTMALAGV